MAKTRKQRKGVMTIPQLRKAFDHMESFTTSLLKKTKDHVSRRKAFQKEWSRVFHRSVDDKATDAYLKFEEKKHGVSHGKTKKQRGGAPLEGAPLDYSTRPGIYGVYGQFPAYVDSGLDFYNKINIQAPTAGCGKENTTPYVPISIGSNEVTPQKGGKKSRKGKTRKYKGGALLPSLGQVSEYFGLDKLANNINDYTQSVGFRPIMASVPTSALYDLQTSMKNPMNLPASPNPNTATPAYIPHKPTTFDATATDIQRNLTKEIRA